MEESLVVSIRARIDALMGVSEVENELKSLHERVNDSAPLEPVDKMRNSPLYQDLAKNVNPSTLSEFQQQLSDPAKFLMQDITGDALDFQKKMERYYGAALLPKNQWWGRKRKTDEFMDWSMEGMQDFVKTAEKELLSGTLSEEEKSLRKAELAAIRQAFEDVGKTLVSSFEKYLDPTKNIGDPSLLDMHTKGGMMSNIESIAKIVITSLAVGPVAQQTLKNYLIDYRGELVDEQVSSRYRTSFNVGDLMGNYSQQQMAQFYEETIRSQYAMEKLKGTGAQVGNVTGIAGTIIGGAVGGLPGAFAGGQAAKGITDLFIGKEVGEQEINLQKYLTEQQSKIESELKFMSELLANVAPKVQAYYQYDIAGARGRARIGSAGGRSQFDYMTLPEQVQEQIGFAETSGFYDNSIYRQQHDFAQMHGIEPSQVFNLNRFRWLTGRRDIGARDLSLAMESTKTMYGDNVDPSKALKLLESMLQVQTDQLKYSIKADMEKGMELSKLPSLLFGNADPYGRIDQFGPQTLSQLGNILQPKSLAADAWLFQKLGMNLEDYTNVKIGGLNNAENLPAFVKAMKGLDFDLNNSPALVDNRQNQFATVMSIMDMYKTQGMGTKVLDLFTTGETEITEMVDGKEQKRKLSKEEFFEKLSKAAETGEKFTLLGESTDALKDSQERYIKLLRDGAEESVAASKRSIKALSDQAAGIGGTWKSMVESMQYKTNDYLKILSEVPGIFDKFTKMQDLSMGYHVAKMYRDGMIKAEQADDMLLRVLTKPESLGLILREVFSQDPKFWEETDVTLKPDKASDKQKRRRGRVIKHPGDKETAPYEEFYDNEGNSISREEWLKLKAMNLNPNHIQSIDDIVSGRRSPQLYGSNNSAGGSSSNNRISEQLDILTTAVRSSQAVVNLTLVKDDANEIWKIQGTTLNG